MTPKRTLVLLRRPPYAGVRALESLDAALVAAVFEQDVSVLFRDDGVWILLKDQDGTPLGTRTVSEVLATFPDYGIDSLFVCRESLEERGIAVGDLVLPAKPIDHREQGLLIAAQHVVLSD